MEKKLIILDGGMGTDLQQAGLKPGENPAVYAMNHGEQVRDIHCKYIESGTNCIYTNTFGASAPKLKGTGYSVQEVVTENVRIAREATSIMAEKGLECMVALDVGPLGELLEPLGTLPFEEAYRDYAEIVIAGKEAGADVVVFETFTDLYEMKAAVLAARENSNLPIWATMSFEEKGRTFLGTSAASMALTLEGLGVSAMGINCSLGPKEILPIAETLMEWTNVPIIIKPNAGLPDPRTGEYDISAKEFAEQMVPFLEKGVGIVGGCCGTNRDFIRELSGKASFYNPEGRIPRSRKGVCSAGSVAEYGNLNIIGERINPTGIKELQQALRDGDMDYIKTLAVEQCEAGAKILDINVGAPGVDEVKLMPQVIKAVQSVVDIPLQLDSIDPAVLRAGLRVVNGRPIINSVNGERERLDSVFPLVREYGTAVLGLTMDQEGIPENAEGRIQVAEKILAEADEYGVDREDVIIDCLTLTVSAQQEQAKETLQAVRRIHDEFGLHCALGVSNISYGLPMRKYVNSSFLTLAMNSGLDFPIVNINEKSIRDAVAAFKVLSGIDEDSAEYIRIYGPEEAEQSRKEEKEEKDVAGKKLEEKQSSAEAGKAKEDPLQAAVIKGLEKETQEITKELLQKEEVMSIISRQIIPALDKVGELYETGEFFLPQLLNAATAACAGLDLIKAEIAVSGAGQISKGRIILATVEGDIHDIGKNIVKVVLENYGYEVLDLGRDVPVQTVVNAAIANDVRLVGLSALMTTTVPAMKSTIEALREAGHSCKIMVGGAVMTPEYAKEIGADYYSKDAQSAVAIAKEVLG